MEKEEAVKLLEKKGFTVMYESGVPIVVYEGGEKEMKETYKKAAAFLKEKGYTASFGVRGDTKNRQQSAKTAYTQLKENEDGQMSLL
ncbi:MAG: hypothetical protein K2N90_00035 [Lachnospiraceae bacterium]|nr:hypothetical protein [Lachnospiraceae bacterium]